MGRREARSAERRERPSRGQRAQPPVALESDGENGERRRHVEERAQPGEVLHAEPFHADVGREDRADDASGRVGRVDPPDGGLAEPAAT